MIRLFWSRGGLNNFKGAYCVELYIERSVGGFRSFMEEEGKCGILVRVEVTLPISSA